MSLTDLLLKGNGVTREELADELACAERDAESWRREANDRARRIDLALKLIDMCWESIHLNHKGAKETCLDGGCVVVRKRRGEVAR